MLVGASPSRLYRNRFMKPARAEDGSVVGGSTTASSTSEGQPSCPVEKIAGESITSLQGASLQTAQPRPARAIGGCCGSCPVGSTTALVPNTVGNAKFKDGTACAVRSGPLAT